MHHIACAELYNIAYLYVIKMNDFIEIQKRFSKI